MCIVIYYKAFMGAVIYWEYHECWTTAGLLLIGPYLFLSKFCDCDRLGQFYLNFLDLYKQ